MVTNTSLPHSSLKKRNQANTYHRVQEAAAPGIVSIVHVDTGYNLADMGTKSLNGVKQQFFLKNQKFPLVSTAGECRKDAQVKSVSGSGKLVIGELSRLDEEVGLALENPRFVTAMMKFYKA